MSERSNGFWVQFAPPARILFSSAATAAMFVILSSCAGEMGSIPIQIRHAILTDKITVETDRVEGVKVINILALQERDSFDASIHRKIHAYVDVENYTGKARIEWVRPDGEIFHQKSFSFKGQASGILGYGEMGIALRSSIRMRDARAYPGKWTTRIYINDALSETLSWVLKNSATSEGLKRQRNAEETAVKGVSSPPQK